MAAGSASWVSAKWDARGLGPLHVKSQSGHRSWWRRGSPSSDTASTAARAASAAVRAWGLVPADEPPWARGPRPREGLAPPVVDVVLVVCAPGADVVATGAARRARVGLTALVEVVVDEAAAGAPAGTVPDIGQGEREPGR